MCGRFGALAIGPVAQHRCRHSLGHANLIGGYLIGVCVALFEHLPELDPAWRLALVTGFLGALTTFSSFSAEVVAMLMQSRYAMALGTAAMHLLGSLALTVAGIWSFQAWVARA